MEPATVSLFLALLTLAADALVIVTALAAVGGRASPAIRRFRHWLGSAMGESGLWLAWLVATVATLGSLYYSEVADFVPCRLCWYQRIAMYPLAVILAIAGARGDRDVARYVVPVAGIGGAISLYHYGLQWFPTLESGACSLDVPCTAFYVKQFGFVSIPFMALSAFALIITAVLAARSADVNDDDRIRTDIPEETAP